MPISKKKNLIKKVELEVKVEAKEKVKLYQTIY